MSHSHRTAAPDRDALLDAAAQGDAAAREALVTLDMDRAARDQVALAITQRQAEQHQAAEATQRAADEQAQREQAAAHQAAQRVAAHAIETALREGDVLPLALIRDLTAAARAEYPLTHRRAALATEERVLDWLVVRLGLPTPWVIPKVRQRMTLAQLLGLDPVPTSEDR